MLNWTQYTRNALIWSVGYYKIFSFSWGWNIKHKTSNELLGVVKEDVIETLGSGLDTYREWNLEYSDLENTDIGSKKPFGIPCS